VNRPDWRGRLLYAEYEDQPYCLDMWRFTTHRVRWWGVEWRNPLPGWWAHMLNTASQITRAKAFELARRLAGEAE